MKRIASYRAPTSDDLARLKEQLGYTRPQMADLAGLGKGSQWSKYASPSANREISMHMHFYMAALLTLSAEQLEQVVITMGSQGADVQTGPLPAGPQRIVWQEAAYHDGDGNLESGDARNA
ncbi:XRE family transcriptional regulator [Pseudomonas sp.]|jgi:hypothetical protein|uniref:XRE family transcriptional regulator n=1 Tax=Pseudomonas sp. TaxID=306 RepID=UPI002ED84B1A